MGKACQCHPANRGQPYPRLTSRFLEARASEFTNAKFAHRLGFPLTQRLLFPVFETTLGEKTVYCCLAGGHLDRVGAVWFTAIGQAAFEALLRLPTTTAPVILRELKLGRVPLHRKSGRLWKRRRRVPAFAFLAIWLANWIAWPLRH